MSGCVIEGTWACREHSWVAKAGEFVRESPGRPCQENGIPIDHRLYL